jgi:hypothetical protein
MSKVSEAFDGGGGGGGGGFDFGDAFQNPFSPVGPMFSPAGGLHSPGGRIADPLGIFQGILGRGGGAGGPTTTTQYGYDPAVSEHQIDIGKRQQAMAEEQWEMYKEFFMPYEIEAAQANQELLPLITEASKTTLGLQAPVTKEFYRQSLEGVDVGEKMDEAQAEVMHATRLGEGQRRREMSRYGIDPSSSTYANLANEAALTTARGVAGARTAAKTRAEDEKYRRLGFSLGKGVYQTQVGPGIDPYARAASSYSQAASTYTPLVNRVLSTTTTGPPSDYNRSGGLVGGILGGIIGNKYGGSQGAGVGYNIGSGIGGMV